jgi:hypothetical protein
MRTPTDQQKAKSTKNKRISNLLYGSHVSATGERSEKPGAGEAGVPFPQMYSIERILEGTTQDNSKRFQCNTEVETHQGEGEANGTETKKSEEEDGVLDGCNAHNGHAKENN